MAEPAHDDLYERDFYAWTQDQAARLRALGTDNRFDVAHVAEEIEDLGASKRSALASHTRQALEHLVLLAASPTNDPRARWTDEVDLHCEDMRDLVEESPTLANKLDLDEGWRRAVRAANRKLARDDEPTVTADDTCPVTLAALTDDDRDLAHLEAAVSRALTADRDARGSGSVPTSGGPQDR